MPGPKDPAVEVPVFWAVAGPRVFIERVAQALREAGVDEAEIGAFIREAQRGSPGGLWPIAERWVRVEESSTLTLPPDVREM